MQELFSQTIETEEEAFSGDFCKCGHLKSEHNIEFSTTNCEALIYI